MLVDSEPTSQIVEQDLTTLVTDKWDQIGTNPHITSDELDAIEELIFRQRRGSILECEDPWCFFNLNAIYLEPIESEYDYEDY